MATTSTGTATLGQLFEQAGSPEVRPVERSGGVQWGLAEATQLKALRQSRGLAQAEVARATGITRRRYSNIEWVPSPAAKMQENPSKPSARELAAILAFFSK